jgi:hypothetical protein
MRQQSSQTTSQVLPVARATHAVRSSTALVQAISTCLTSAAGHSLTSKQVLAAAAADDAAALERQMQASLAAMQREVSGNADASEQTESGAADSEPFAGKRVAVLQATKRDAINIRERDRSLGGLSSVL